MLSRKGGITVTDRFASDASPLLTPVPADPAAWASAIRTAAAEAPAPRFLVAIDGRCGAGKTTFATALARELACTLFHMDDFFLRPTQRTPARLSTPGENIDHERFLDEVLRPLRNPMTEAVSLRRFDCTTRTLMSPVTVPLTSICLVEGSYACHPDLRPYYDLRLFLDVAPAIRQMRLLSREGETGLAVFNNRWIPLEEAYLTACCVREGCDHVLIT